MADYKIELGINFTGDKELNNIKKQLTNLTDNTHRVRIDIDNSRLLKQIEHAKRELKELNSTNGNQPSLTVNTQSLEKSLNRVADVIDEVRRSLGTLDSKSGMNNLVSSINQIVKALGKAENESDSLVKSLSTLSKKEFGFNFNLKTGNANPVKAATDYGIEARRKAIPAMKEQVAFLQDILGGTEKADKALERYLVKQNKGFGGISEKNKLQREMLGGVDLDGKTISYNKQMGAYEQTISYLKKIAVESGKSLDGFDSQFSKAAENIVDDTIKIQTGAKQTEESLEAVSKEMKQFFGGGISADGLSASLEPIVANLNQIRETIVNLSKGASLEGLTSSFDRLSSSIENLLTNAQKVKGILNSGFKASAIDTDIDYIKTVATSNKKTTGRDYSSLDKYLSQWNLKKDAAKNIKSRFISLAESSYRGMDDDLYESSLNDLINTIKNLGVVSKQADDYLKDVFDALNGRVIDAPLSEYKEEFTDEWANIKRNYQTIFANKNSTVKMPVDSFYEDLKERFPDLFPESIYNNKEQLRRILDVYDIAKVGSKNRKVDISSEYSDSYLRDEASDVVRTIQEQIRAEHELAQASTQSTNTVVKNEVDKRQEYEKTLSQRKQEIADKKRDLEQLDDDIKWLEGTIHDPEKIKDIPQDSRDKYFEALDETGIARDNLESEIKQLEAELQSVEQQAKQTADAVQSVSKEHSLIRDGFDSERVFNTGNQSADEAKRYFKQLLKDENGTIVDTIGHFDSTELKSFTVDIKRATGEVEKLNYELDELDGTFRYKGGSVSDKAISRQVKQSAKKADALQIDLDEIKTGYSDAGAPKPIKEEGHIKSLAEQYEIVEQAIKDVRTADNATYDSMVANAEREKAKLEGLVRVYRNAETFSTDLRAKDKDTAKEIYSSRLDVLSSKMKKDGVYDGLETDVNDLANKISGASDVKVLSEVSNELAKLDAKYKSAKAAKDEFNNSKNVGSNVSILKSEIENLQRIDPAIKNFKTEVNGAEVSIESLLKDLNQVGTSNDFKAVQGEVKAFEKAAEAAGIAVRETAQKAKSINDIKIKLNDTGFNGFEQEVKRAHIATEELEGTYEELDFALKNLDVAMEAVYSADKANDSKRLVAANEKYEASLKQVYSQLKLNQQAEQKTYKDELLNQKKASLNSDIEIWLKENTRAAKDFGEELRRLQASLDGLDDKGIKLAGQQFKNITKQVQTMGKTGLTTFDKLKSKAKEYMTYLSAAEMFMYAEQALRSMFNTVKEIDTAMTGLYRVTDLTAAEYDSLFDNMISSAKEYGATLNDIINATTDWVRAGFDANTSLGLAEVTTMYQHISDLDYDTAAENLITAYNGFKDELNGAFSGDTVSAVNYIADIFNELDNTFAVTSAGLGEALTRSASALDLAGNTIQETAG